MNNDSINAMIRAAARPQHQETTKPTSALRRADFESDEAFFHARALEKIQMDSPEYRNAFRDAQRELAAEREAAEAEAMHARRAELLKSTSLDYDEEKAVSSTAMKAAEAEFAAGKITHADIAHRAREIGDSLRERAVTDKVNTIMFNEKLREKLWENSGRLNADGTTELFREGGSV